MNQPQPTALRRVRGGGELARAELIHWFAEFASMSAWG